MERVRIVYHQLRVSQIWTYDGEILSVLGTGGLRWYPYPKAFSKDIWEHIINLPKVSDEVEIYYI